MDNSKKALTSGIWYTVSNFLTRAIGMITTPIFTRLLTQEEFGMFSNFISWQSLLAIFVTLNLESTLISARFDFREKFDEYIFSVLSLSSLSALVWILAANVFIGPASELLGMGSVYINALLVYLAFSSAVNMFMARERYYFEYKKTALIGICVSVGTSLLSVVLILTMRDRLFARVIGSIAPGLLLGVILYLFFVVKGRRIRVCYWKYAIPICLPYIPHLLSMTVLNSTDRIMITHWCSPTDTAMYSLAYTCGSLITLLLTSMNSAFAPWLGEHLDEKKFEEIRGFSQKYIAVFLLFSIGIMLAAPEILLILGGKRYLAAKYVMPPVAVGCVCQFLYTLFVNVEQFYRKTAGMAAASVLAALINVALNALFIPRIGYLAAAYTTLVGYVCLLLMHMYLVRRIGYARVYDYKYVLLAVCLAVVLMVLITLLYQSDIIRYLVTAGYAAVLLGLFHKNKDTILGMLKR